MRRTDRLPTLREVLRELHSPLTGTLRAEPGSKEWCRACGGVIRHPCPTRRLIDGQHVDPSELDPSLVGVI